MTGRTTGNARFILILLILLLAVQACVTTVSAGDEIMARILPGEWAEEEEGAGAVLTLEEDGRVTLYCYNADSSYASTSHGTWAFEYVQDYNDRLILRLDATDDPAYAGRDYHVECVYEAYTESWMEGDTQFTYLILTDTGSEGAPPFQAAFGDGDVALHREQGPNMRVVNCSSYVSLREKRSTSAKRTAKVPLGALVLAFPEYGDENGFLLCWYNDDYGYILKEYLEPVD